MTIGHLQVAAMQMVYVDSIPARQRPSTLIWQCEINSGKARINLTESRSDEVAQPADGHRATA